MTMTMTTTTTMLLMKCGVGDNDKTTCIFTHGKNSHYKNALPCKAK